MHVISCFIHIFLSEKETALNKALKLFPSEEKRKKERGASQKLDENIRELCLVRQSSGENCSAVACHRVVVSSRLEKQTCLFRNCCSGLPISGRALWLLRAGLESCCSLFASFLKDLKQQFQTVSGTAYKIPWIWHNVNDKAVVQTLMQVAATCSSCLLSHNITLSSCFSFPLCFLFSLCIFSRAQPRIRVS